jgi:hypothetical protein
MLMRGLLSRHLVVRFASESTGELIALYRKNPFSMLTEHRAAACPAPIG